MPGTLTAEAIALPNVLANFDPAAGLKEPLQPVGLDVALTPVAEASTATTPRLKTIAGGCGPLACAGCPFAQQCRGESAASILKTPTTSEPETKSTEAVTEPTVVEESVAPAAKTPEPAPLKIEKPAPIPVQAAKAPEAKPAVAKSAPIVVQPKAERAPQPTPAPVSHAVAERPARVEATPINRVAPEQPKEEAVVAKPTPTIEAAPFVEIQTSAPTVPEIATPLQPIAVQEVATPVTTVVEHRHSHPQQPVVETGHTLDVAAIQATREMTAAQLIASPDSHAAAEQPGEATEHPVAVAETSPKDSSSDTAITPKTQTASPKARAHTVAASSPAARTNASQEVIPVTTTEEATPETHVTATSHTTRATSKKSTPELTAHQAAAPIAEKLVAKLTSGNVASIDTRINELLTKIEKHENNTHTTASTERPERLIAATLKSLSELLDIEPEELERALQTTSSHGEAQITQLVELLTGLQKLTRGSVSRHEIDRLLNQSFLHSAFGSPWSTVTQTQQSNDNQPHRIWSLGILVMSSILLKYSRQGQNSLIPA